MYNNTFLPATGMAVAFWWPLAGFALIAVGCALWRIGVRRSQPTPDGADA